MKQKNKKKEIGADAIIDLIRRKRPMRLAGLLRYFPDEVKLTSILFGLERKGQLVRKGDKWALPRVEHILEGRYGTQKGMYASVLISNPGNGPKRVSVPISRAAWPGDIVRVSISEEDWMDKGAMRGVVTQVVTPCMESIPVVVHRRRDRVWGVPLDPAFERTFDLENVPEDLADGTTILAKPLDRGEEGVAHAAFDGDCGDLASIAVQEKLVKLNKDVPGEFPEFVLAEARSLPDNPGEEDFKGRRDMRDIPFVTIDGADARDFDDAIHVERRPDGWILRVAIADVSHYVRPRTGLDKEALRRGNSWYFPTSVEPMLPKELSNGLCSLVPDRPRLVMWAEMSFTRSAKVLSANFGCGVIRSAARLTYDGVKAMLLDKDAAAISEFKKTHAKGEAVLAMLEDAMGLYEALRRMRIERGSLDFDLPDSKALFDEKGHVTELIRPERHDIHRLIEEFMIAANEAVARRLRDAGIDFLYRTHPLPNSDRLDDLRKALEFCGVEVVFKESDDNGPAMTEAEAFSHRQPRTQGRKHRSPERNEASKEKGGSRRRVIDIAAILSAARGTPTERTIGNLCVRSMPQARYGRVNCGHFGLASKDYCHFTSPIRRYADLLIHRGLKHVLGMDGGTFPVGERLDHVAEMINRRERSAMECEREMARRLACMWLTGQEDNGPRRATVITVMGFGVFVELDEAPVEGLIRVQDLGLARNVENDWYEYDEARCMLVSRGGRDIWHTGRHCTVVCERADLASLEVDFRPVPDNALEGGAGVSPDRDGGRKPSSRKQPSGRPNGKPRRSERSDRQTRRNDHRSGSGKDGRPNDERRQREGERNSRRDRKDDAGKRRSSRSEERREGWNPEGRKSGDAKGRKGRSHSPKEHRKSKGHGREGISEVEEIMRRVK